MTQYLKKYQNKVKEFGPGFEKYFNLHYDEKSQAFILPEDCLLYTSFGFAGDCLSLMILSIIVWGVCWDVCWGIDC